MFDILSFNCVMAKQGLFLLPLLLLSLILRMCATISPSGKRSLWPGHVLIWIACPPLDRILKPCHFLPKWPQAWIQGLVCLFLGLSFQEWAILSVCTPTAMPKRQWFVGGGGQSMGMKVGMSTCIVWSVGKQKENWDGPRTGSLYNNAPGFGDPRIQNSNLASGYLSEGMGLRTYLM